MKKIWLKVILFFKCLTMGAKQANDIMFSQDGEADGSPNGIEQKKIQKSVYDDLLRGELTQEVIELRHEMYYSERESKNYEYSGNGHAHKKSIFGYNGKLYDNDGLKVEIVQENKEDNYSLSDFGIFSNGTSYELSKEDVKEGKKEFTLHINREFRPSMKLEEFATKIVVKGINGNKKRIDVYVPSYAKQYDRISRIFNNKMVDIFCGDTHSDILDFKEISFISNNAYGTSDLKLFEYSDLKFVGIEKYDGSYVLQFDAVEKNVTDLIAEFYDEKTAKKCESNEMREGATFDLGNELESEYGENFDVDEAIYLKNELDA